MITVVCSITNPKVFLYRLAKSLLQEKNRFELILTDPKETLPKSYNSIGKVKTNYLMIVHQDVSLKEGGDFLRKIENQANNLPNFGIGGVIGWKFKTGERFYGGLYRTREGFQPKKETTKFSLDGIDFDCKVKRKGRVVLKAEEVDMLDDMIFLINSKLWNLVKFDEEFLFHGIAEDYCLKAKEKGYKLFVLPVKISTIPSSKRRRQAQGSVQEAKKRLSEKWNKKYPEFYTCIGWVKGNPGGNPRKSKKKKGKTLFTIVCSVTKPEEFEKRLKRSLELETMKYKLILADPNLPYAESLNSIGNITTPYVMFVHQDIVFMEKGKFLEKVAKICNNLPKMGVVGVSGNTVKRADICKDFKTHIGKKANLNTFTLKWDGREYRVRDRRESQGRGFKKALKVDTIDDQIVIIPRKLWNKEKFDSEHFDFHLVVDDYCCTARFKYGLNVYAIPLLTWRLESKGLEEHPNLEKAKNAFREKWKEYLPIGTIFHAIKKQ